MSRVTLIRAQAAKRSALRRFKRLGKVTGVGITRVGGKYAVKMNVSEPFDPAIDVPAEIDGVPLRVEVTGRVRPRANRRS
jgi:hypothetical protein